MKKEELKKLYEQQPEPILCSLKDSKGNNCPGIPEFIVTLEGNEIYFCDDCYINYLHSPNYKKYIFSHKRLW